MVSGGVWGGVWLVSGRRLGDFERCLGGHVVFAWCILVSGCCLGGLCRRGICIGHLFSMTAKFPHNCLHFVK